MMRRILALALVSLLLAGCTQAPAPGPSNVPAWERLDQGSPATSEDVRGEPASLIPAASPPATPSPATTPPAAPSPAPAAESPLAPEEEPASPPAPSTTPAPAPPSTAAPTGPPTVALPTLRVKDQWTYRGADPQGQAYDEWFQVQGNGTVGSIPTYQVSGTLRSQPFTANLTRDGMNQFDEGGFVLELLRFPLAPNATWTFGRSQGGDVLVGNVSYGSVWENTTALVEVVEWGSVRTTGGRFDAYHLRANVTTTLGSRESWSAFDYWYAPMAKAIVKLEQRKSDGSSSWADLVWHKVAKDAA